MADLPDDPVWLFRGVPVESHEVADVESDGEVCPPRPDRLGEYWRRQHCIAGVTDTAYTSWSVDRDIAVAAAQQRAMEAGLSGTILVFRVQVESLDEERVFDGRVDEGEYLLEGTVEGIEFSDALEEENDED